LTNEDVKACDSLVTIPASPKHPSLNLSHAVAVVAYELTESKHPVKRPRAASRQEVEKMLEFLDRILDHMNLPEHRRRTTTLTFRKLLGRAMMSKWEYHRMMGVFNGALRAMEEVRRQGKTVRGLRRVASGAPSPRRARKP
jgi:tRNA C32,U32 (ribose-2'-O)-methylase TrmJ